MRNLFISSFLLVSSLAFASGGVLTAKVKGMHCDSCAQKITADLKKLPEVADASVDFESKTAKVVLKENATFTPAQLKASIEKSGYEAEKISTK